MSSLSVDTRVKQAQSSEADPSTLLLEADSLFCCLKQSQQHSARSRLTLFCSKQNLSLLEADPSRRVSLLLQAGGWGLLQAEEWAFGQSVGLQADPAATIGWVQQPRTRTYIPTDQRLSFHPCRSGGLLARQRLAHSLTNDIQQKRTFRPW